MNYKIRQRAKNKDEIDVHFGGVVVVLVNFMI